MAQTIGRLRRKVVRLLQFPNIVDDDERLRIWIVRRVFLFAFVANSLMIFMVRNDLTAIIQVAVVFPALILGYLFFQYACRQGHSYWASAILIALFWLWLVLFAVFQSPFEFNSNFHLIGVAVVMATILLGTRAGALTLVATIFVGVMFLWLETTTASLLSRVPAARPMQFTGSVFVLGLTFALVATGRDQLTKALRHTREARRQSEAGRLALAEVNADIERQISARTQELEATLKQQDDLLRIVAHDLKNPLASVALSLDMLIRYPEKMSSEQKDRRLRKARRAVDEMTDTITRLLEASRIESGQVAVNIEKVSLEAIVDTVVDDFEGQAEAKSIALEVQCDESLIVWADAQLLGQVLANLVSNALKYSPAGSQVTLDWSRRSDYVSLSISDEGQGLTLDDMSKLYTKFTRLSAKPTAGESSAGLGLYIVKLFIEAMSGTVAAESGGRNQGSTFTIELPLASIEGEIEADLAAPLTIVSNL